MLDTYQRIKDAGYCAVIAVHPTSELTGSYQNSLTAIRSEEAGGSVLSCRSAQHSADLKS
ncbi:hypothetical protein [Macrococcus carouselicus]|uniref:Uncharacterized protein n=1 Tax=Macrococcus carouselicus TaxID=69969 RepID=A0A9Q8CME6_9STAP|nr:hypothetical protein [Macrococcus carouselicus]TDM03627.1 hypothetical protein ERX40_00205 [Macrococcus carouselicus]